MIKLKNNKNYVNFTELKTGNAITRQWNNIKFAAGKKQVSLAELEYILETSTNKDVIADVIKYYNPQVKKHNKATGDNKKWFNKQNRTKKSIKELAEINKEKAKQEKMKDKKEITQKVLDKVGLGNSMQKELYMQIGNVIIPNAKMVGVDFADIAQELLEIGVDAGYDLDEITQEINIKKLEHERFIEEVKKINMDKVKEIEDETNIRLNNFLFEHSDVNTKNGVHHGYFGYIIGKEIEQEKLKVLMQQLNAGEKLAVENVMLSNEFLKLWCSDQDSACYDSEFREQRLDEIIAIIENHIGKGTQFNETTGQIDFYNLKTNNATTTGIRLNDYIGI